MASEDMDMKPAAKPRPKQNPVLKLALELGPLLLFFGANAKFGIFPATGVLMASVVVALALSWFLTRHLPVMPMVTAVAVLAFGKPLLPVVLDSVLRLTETGWRILTLRWGVFFFFLAILNEAVWRTQSTDFWVSFKVFGTMPITMLFALAQVPLILKHELKEPEGEADHW